MTNSSDSRTNPRFTGANRAALILVGVLSLLGLAYAIARVDILRARLGVQRIALESTQLQLTQTQQQLQALQAEQQQQAANWQVTQRTIDHLGSGLTEQILQAQQLWVRADVLYLARLAQDQLSYNYDIVRARNTLGAAVVRAQSYPGALPTPLVQELSGVLTTLDQLPSDPTAAVKQALSKAVTQVPMLPLAATRPVTTAAAPDGVWARVREAVAKLVLVRRSGEEVSVVATAQDEIWQRHALQQHLWAAHMAADRHDQGGYTQALTRAMQWLEQAFDIRAPACKQLQGSLQTLASENIAPTLPDLEPAIGRLQSLLNERSTP